MPPIVAELPAAPEEPAAPTVFVPVPLTSEVELLLPGLVDAPEVIPLLASSVTVLPAVLEPVVPVVVVELLHALPSIIATATRRKEVAFIVFIVSFKIFRHLYDSTILLLTFSF
ncbi:hypothetical protein ASU33_17395 [Solirubrum puertoriconensis]|uniref:Uncharacterized protein n=1 Tax=Solirubrum puertoriconensis TaxID=1751427 RepID=A0A9X0HP42_SOLP1|nr:hypothetical protein ASU33_17395 [Solirubrum puertoriconensis]